MKKYEELGASPAPWEEDKEAALPDIICHLQNGIRYQVAVPYIHSDEETDANTRLICAAPDMYDALFDILFKCTKITNCRNCKGHELGNCGGCPLGKARAALAKAAGEEE